MKTTAEMIAVMQAYVDGKEIEMCAYGTCDWLVIPLNRQPLWNWGDYSYRVKPEPEYIPFTFEDAEFLIDKIVKHETKPIIEKLISFGLESANAIFYEELLENFTFLDGSPCGKLKSK